MTCSLKAPLTGKTPEPGSGPHPGPGPVLQAGQRGRCPQLLPCPLPHSKAGASTERCEHSPGAEGQPYGGKGGLRGEDSWAGEWRGEHCTMRHSPLPLCPGCPCPPADSQTFAIRLAHGVAPGMFGCPFVCVVPAPQCCPPASGTWTHLETLTSRRERSPPSP